MIAAIGAISAMLAVAAGAFEAHALRGVLPEDRLDIFEVAARYQFYHALGLVAIGLSNASSRLRWCGFLFIGGTLVFSGSLYALALGGPRWLGAITPIGGVAFILGWLTLAWLLAGSARDPSRSVRTPPMPENDAENAPRRRVSSDVEPAAQPQR